MAAAALSTETVAFAKPESKATTSDSSVVTERGDLPVNQLQEGEGEEGRREAGAGEVGWRAGKREAREAVVASAPSGMGGHGRQLERT